MMTETDLSEAVINSSYAAIATNRALSNRVSEIRSAERHLANRIQQLKLDRQVLDERQSELDMFLSELKIPYELSLVARRLREFSPLLNGKEDLILKEIIQTMSVIGRCERSAQSRLFDLRVCLASQTEQLELVKVELQRKETAREIDQDQLDLCDNFSQVSFKSNPNRISLGEISHEKWLAAGEQLNHEINLQSQRVLTLAKETIGEIADGRRSLTDQMDRIRRTLERSIRFINDVRDETKFQMTQICRQIDDLKKNISQLETLSDQKLTSLTKLVETRLENRNFRRPLYGERVADPPQLKLKLEMETLEQIKRNTAETVAVVRREMMKFEGEKQLQQRELDSLEGQLQLEKETFDILFRTRDSISTAKLT